MLNKDYSLTKVCLYETLKPKSLMLLLPDPGLLVEKLQLFLYTTLSFMDEKCENIFGCTKVI